MVLSKEVLSMDKALVQSTLMMFSVLGMSQVSLTVPTPANTTVPIRKMLESSVELSVSEVVQCTP